jgi:hypothetical protein
MGHVVCRSAFESLPFTVYRLQFTVQVQARQTARQQGQGQEQEQELEYCTVRAAEQALSVQ